MTKPLIVTRSQAAGLIRNVEGKPKRQSRHEAPRRVTIHVAPDVKPETVAALAALALRVMGMPEDELREFLKKVRRK